MSVRRPLEKIREKPLDIDALIEKGAKVKEDQEAKKKKSAFVNLRIPVEMLKEVDQAVSERVGINRTGWILEAIHEKLKSR